MAKRKKKGDILTILIVLVSLCIVAVIIMDAFFYAPAGESSGISLPENLSRGMPVPGARGESAGNKIPISPLDPSRLIIPSIGVNANVQYVGVTASGNMGTPDNFSDVAWYRDGTLPGNSGNAVIAGHVNDGLALPAVFWNLGELKAGDDIYVQRANGNMLHFVVTGSETFAYNAKTTGVFDGGNEPQLKLITCAGTFLSSIHTHNERLVVTARLVS